MVKRIAVGTGIVFLLMGGLGLVSAGGMEMGTDPVPAMLLGFFPVNLLHSVAHLLTGVWGVVASRSFAWARRYAQIAGGIYLALMLLGFFVPASFGLMPIGGNDVWLHGALGFVLAAAGFTAKDEVAVG